MLSVCTVHKLWGMWDPNIAPTTDFSSVFRSVTARPVASNSPPGIYYLGKFTPDSSMPGFVYLALVLGVVP